MKALIVQVPTNSQTQPHSTQNHSIQGQGVDPWILVWAGIGSAFTGISAFLLKASESAIVSKSIDGRMQRKQAESNASIVEKLTKANVDKQEAETLIDLSNAVADIAKSGVDNSADYNKALLNIVRESISASQLNAESRDWFAKATENLADAQKETIRATENLAEGVRKLAQAQEISRQEILRSHELAISEFKSTCNKLSKQMINTERTVKEELAGAIAQLRRDIKEVENKLDNLKNA